MKEIKTKKLDYYIIISILGIMMLKSIKDIDNKYISKLPEQPAVVQYYFGDKLVYLTKTGNLQNHLFRQYKLREKKHNTGTLFTIADNLSFKVTESLIDALKAEKALLQKYQPEYNNQMAEWRSYVYLALNPIEFPFVKITDFTEEDWFYIGPFRSRFFLIDILELMGKLLKLPFCEVPSGPCEKKDIEHCRGWCQYANFSTTQKESEPHPELSKLDALLKEAYVHPNNKLLEMIAKQKENYEDNLEFIKADLLKDQIDLLSKYREWLQFLYIAKDLNYIENGLDVVNGQLIHFIWEEQEYYCPLLDIKYRENERLAINKNMVDEAWILYKEKTKNKVDRGKYV